MFNYYYGNYFIIIIGFDIFYCELGFREEASALQVDEPIAANVANMQTCKGKGRRPTYCEYMQLRLRLNSEVKHRISMLDGHWTKLCRS